MNSVPEELMIKSISSFVRVGVVIIQKASVPAWKSSHNLLHLQLATKSSLSDYI